MDRIGRYEILGEIGRGGMGVVYRAHDPVMRRDVAVKVLTTVSDPALSARFQSEAGTTGSLRHKNIIIVYDYGEHENRPFLVMELLDGRSLHDAIRNGASLPLFEKVSVLFQVAEGLRYAHGQGVVHRDVKPSNVMLLNDGSAKILDFGIARYLDAAKTRYTTPGLLIGTIEYMAPDQLQGVDADELTDIFSFGVTCYEFLSGHQPFRADTASRVMYLLANADPAPLCQVAPGCPEALQNIVRTALEKRRSQRYQSLQDLLFDLAPIEAALRKQGAAELAGEAGRLIETGGLDEAQSALNRALGLDPACEKGQELRRVIQKHRERGELLRQAEALITAGEERMAARSFDAAAEAFAGALRIVPTDLGQMRSDVERRLFAASQSRETARRFAALLVEAREVAQRGDLPAALRLATEASALDPSDAEAAGLERELAAEVQRLEAEAERQRQERLRRERTISGVTQAVRGHVGARRFTEALRLVEGALGQYPGDEVLETVRATVGQARLQYVAQLEAERQEAIDRQRRAEEQLRRLEAEGGEERQPGQEPRGEPVPEATAIPGARPDAARSRPSRAAPAAPVAGAGSSFQTREFAGPVSRQAFLSESSWKRTLVFAVAGLVVMVLGFWLMLRSPDDRSSQLGSLVQQAVQGRDWEEAERRLDDYARTKPLSDPDVADLRKQIGEGRQSKLAALRDTIARAIAANQWPQAEADIGRFERLAPGDPDIAKWRKQVEASRKLDDLRLAIRNAIRGKNWGTAEASLAALLAAAPRDPQAAEWRNEVNQGRKQELSSRQQLDAAKRLLDAGSYAAAINLFERVLKDDPGNAEAQKGLKQAKDAKATEDKVLGRDS
jgi:tetratricopeptide (TPR) repeat protein